MKISITCTSDGEPVITNPDGTGVVADYVCWEWNRGDKPRVILGVESGDTLVEAEIEFSGPGHPVIVK